MKRAQIFEIYRDRKRQYRWRLRAGNGKIIATCHEGYVQLRRCVEGMQMACPLNKRERVVRVML